MLDDTLLLTVYGLLVVLMISCAPCHTIIHIQSYTCKRTHVINQWCCAQVCDAFPWEVVYETFLWKAVLVPSSLRLHRCSSADWLSDPWPLRLSPVQFTRVMVGSFGLSNCHPCSARSRVRFCVFYRFTASCHLCCRVSLNSKPTPSWQFDISSGFAVVVLL